MVRGDAALADHDRGGLDVRTADAEAFLARLRAENRTLKRALVDPSTFDGIGNAYSDEILHRAQLSPLRWTSRLDDAARRRLYDCCREVLDEWTRRLVGEAGGKFPRKVTAFRPEMAVHGKFKQDCPVCGAPIQRIRYADNECNYCPGCQTEGRILSDRSLARLLKDDWPKTLDDLE